MGNWGSEAKCRHMDIHLIKANSAQILMKECKCLSVDQLRVRVCVCAGGERKPMTIATRTTTTRRATTTLMRRTTATVAAAAAIVISMGKELSTGSRRRRKSRRKNRRKGRRKGRQKRVKEKGKEKREKARGLGSGVGNGVGNFNDAVHADKLFGGAFDVHCCRTAERT